MTPLAELLAELVRTPSVNPMGRTDIPPEWCLESRVTDLLERKLKALGVPVERQFVARGRENLIARFVPPTPPPFTVIFEAHQDTVPTDGMTIVPFGGRIENGKLYGRGACDVKAGITAMYGAFERLVKANRPGSAEVILAYTVDEEHTFLGVQQLVKSGIRTDFAIVAEPTQLNIIDAHKGVVRWELEVGGIACHSSTPERGISAIYRMAKVVSALEIYANNLAGSHPRLGSPTLCIGMISGGSSPNTVPDSCRINLDRRLLPGETGAGALAEILGILKPLQYEIEVKTILECPALESASESPFIAQLGRAIDAEVGKHERLAVPFGTDAGTLQLAGIPTVVFGPGSIEQAHTKDEWIELTQVNQAAEILFRFATKG